MSTTCHIFLQDMRIATDKNSTLQTQVGGMIVEVCADILLD